MGITEVISTAFLMGTVGSLHCIGMCGPLALALPLGHRSEGGRLIGGVIYNFGRITTYSIFGLILGIAGEHLFSNKVQSILSITLGILILIYLFIPVKKKASSAIITWANEPFIKLRMAMGKLFKSTKSTSLFSIGLLNGLLPCGLVYLAITSSLLTGTALKGSLFMMFFGLGTFPAMLATVFFGSYFNQQFRLKLRNAVPVFLFIMATLLVLRGLNLGIPFISPALPDNPQDAVLCH
ncbi:sulfite exporter TauE/SafE family protein [Chitinophagaceae bacterium LB-8]|uniref:Sulfite exporter TauE/SafE family protein n=1 Tax=Paraflavisolibacter caeni TaxID=2982496 RepID=A0A9X3BIT8_9BACT|nr:sulfite exporter TauE/SafE family protein [Paraflavisolibacter caeni]MCU7551932.1 sulfite exporter TauE/SafE family protein [Paraflavisolibacter caeni]